MDYTENLQKRSMVMMVAVVLMGGGGGGGGRINVNVSKNVASKF